MKTYGKPVVNMADAQRPQTANSAQHFRVIERFLFDGNAAKTRSCGQYLLDNFEYIIGYFRCSNALNLTFQLQPQLIADLRDLNACVECDVQQRQTICETGQQKTKHQLTTPKRPAIDAATMGLTASAAMTASASALLASACRERLNKENKKHWSLVSSTKQSIKAVVEILLGSRVSAAVLRVKVHD